MLIGTSYYLQQSSRVILVSIQTFIKHIIRLYMGRVIDTTWYYLTNLVVGHGALVIGLSFIHSVEDRGF